MLFPGYLLTFPAPILEPLLNMCTASYMSTLTVHNSLFRSLFTVRCPTWHGESREVLWQQMGKSLLKSFIALDEHKGALWQENHLPLFKTMCSGQNPFPVNDWCSTNDWSVILRTPDPHESCLPWPLALFRDMTSKDTFVYLKRSEIVQRQGAKR